MTTQRPTPAVDRPDDARPAHLRSAALVLIASLLLGGATSWAQGVLPDALVSFANSVSGWTICTALLVAAVRPSVRWGALLGPMSFVALVLGYTAASSLRGLSYDPVTWGVLGLLAGPFVGAAAAAVVGGGSRTTTALGAGLLAGVIGGDGVDGLTRVAATTSPVYWTLVLVLAGLLLLSVAVVRLRAVGPVALQLATAVVVAGVLLLGLSGL